MEAELDLLSYAMGKLGLAVLPTLEDVVSMLLLDGYTIAMDATNEEIFNILRYAYPKSGVEVPY